MAEIPSDYPNLRALAQGCVSGRISEWPRLKQEAAALLAENERLWAALESFQWISSGQGDSIDRFDDCSVRTEGVI